MPIHWVEQMYKNQIEYGPDGDTFISWVNSFESHLNSATRDAEKELDLRAHLEYLCRAYTTYDGNLHHSVDVSWRKARTFTAGVGYMIPSTYLITQKLIAHSYFRENSTISSHRISSVLKALQSGILSRHQISDSGFTQEDYRELVGPFERKFWTLNEEDEPTWLWKTNALSR